MKEEWLFPAALIPVDRETTHALVAEIKRLIDVVGGMALAQPEQEPVAWMIEDRDNRHFIFRMQKPEAIVGETLTPLYTTPPKRPWVGLTDDERNAIEDATLGLHGIPIFFATAIEAKLKELNT